MFITHVREANLDFQLQIGISEVYYEITQAIIFDNSRISKILSLISN